MKDETELQSDGLYGGIKFLKKGACESKMKKILPHWHFNIRKNVFNLC